jgi:hypothetical protein
MELDLKAFFKKLWLLLRSHWLGLIAVYAIVFVVVYGLLWNITEPLGIPDCVDSYGLIHVFLTLLFAAYFALLLELGFRKLTWLSFGIKYRIHTQSEGWHGHEWIYDGNIAGRPGSRKRIEAIRIRLGQDFPPGLSVEYQAHVQDAGWEEWVSDGDESGTTGLKKRMEAIKIRLAHAPPGYSIVYRVFVASDEEGGEWDSWVSDGEQAGTTGKGRRIEAIRILVISPRRYGQFWKGVGEAA